MCQRGVKRGRKDRIAIMNDEPVRMQIGQNLTKLLRRPFRGRMSGYITVQNPPGADFHCHEYVQNLEGH